MRNDIFSLLKLPLIAWDGQSFASQAYDAVFTRIVKADRAADDAWECLASPETLRTRQADLREKGLASFGGLPERTPLNARTTGVIQRNGYKIEKIVFESRPLFFVTGHLFLPDSPAFKPPYPGIFVPCGHSAEGKAGPGYQRGGVQGALAGFATFVVDPIDQGERLQAGQTLISCHGHQHTGVRAHLLGEGQAQYRVWDAMRAIDVLCERPDVDSERIGAMGMSGGGTITAYIYAFDERVVDLPGARTIYDILRDKYRAAIAARPPLTQKAVREALGPLGPALREVLPVDERRFDGDRAAPSCRCTRKTLVYDDGTLVPYIAFIPDHAKGHPVLLVAEAERTALAPEVEDYLALGRPVAVTELRGRGEGSSTYKRGTESFHAQKGPDEELARMLDLLGESLVACRAQDIANCAAELSRDSNAEVVDLCAWGAAAIPAAHAAYLWRERFASVNVMRPPAPWAKAFEDNAYDPRFANCVFGALKVYDWPDLLGTFIPSPGTSDHPREFPSLGGTSFPQNEPGTLNS